MRRVQKIFVTATITNIDSYRGGVDPGLVPGLEAPVRHHFYGFGGRQSD